LSEVVPPSELILVTRRPESLADFAARGARVRVGDFDRVETLREAFAGGERMLLISTDRVGGGRAAQHRRAAEAAIRVGVRHIAYTSFVGLGPDNPAISSKEHYGTEQALLELDVALTFLRDNQYAEAMAEFMAPGALQSGVWVDATGGGRVGFVAREDCVACAVAVVSSPGHEGKTYDITGPELVTYRECAALAAELGGRPVEYRGVSDEEKLAFFDSLGVPRTIDGDFSKSPAPWPSEEMVSFERAIREGYFAVVSDAVRTLTGRPPKSLREVYLDHIGLLREAAASRPQ